MNEYQFLTVGLLLSLTIGGFFTYIYYLLNRKYPTTPKVRSHKGRKDEDFSEFFY